MVGICATGARARFFGGPQGKRRIVTAFLLLALALSVVLGTFWGVRETAKGGLKILLDHTDLDVKDVLFTEVGESGEKWEVRAQRARYFRKEQKAVFDQADIRLILPEGRTFRISGDRGNMNTQSRNMELSGNVVVQSDNGDRFTTDRLQYTHVKKLVYTEYPILLENARMRISAVGMKLFLDRKEVALLKKVKAQVR